MEPIVLTDQFVTPNEDLVFSIIGEKRILWQKIMQHLHEDQTDITEVWRFYNDGKCWLFRAIKKNKTLFWIGVTDGTFRVSFWFGDKAEPLIAQSNLPEKIKNDFETAKRYNKIRGVSVTMTNTQDVEDVIQLIGIKLKLK
jgi:hypothetical protein